MPRRKGKITWRGALGAVVIALLVVGVPTIALLVGLRFLP